MSKTKPVIVIVDRHFIGSPSPTPKFSPNIDYVLVVAESNPDVVADVDFSALIRCPAKSREWAAVIRNTGGLSPAVFRDHVRTILDEVSNLRVVAVYDEPGFAAIWNAPRVQ